MKVVAMRTASIAMVKQSPGERGANTAAGHSPRGCRNATPRTPSLSTEVFHREAELFTESVDMSRHSVALSDACGTASNTRSGPFGADYDDQPPARIGVEANSAVTSELLPLVVMLVSTFWIDPSKTLSGVKFIARSPRK